MPSSCRHGKKNLTTVLANAPRPQSESSSEQSPLKPKDQTTRRRRPYFFKMLQHQISTRILADTLDWDGESVLSLPPTPGVPIGVRNLKFPFIVFSANAL